MTRGVMLLLLAAALPASALTVEVTQFGLERHYRRGRPVTLSVRVTTETPFRGELVLDGGPVRRAFALDLPARASRDLETSMLFFQPAAVTWKAGEAGGTLDLGAKEPGAGEALVAVEAAATGRRADKYKMEFPPGSRFVACAFESGSEQTFALVDAAILKDRGTAGRASFLSGLPGSASFRARGGAILWADGPSLSWDGRVDARDDVTWGEDAFAVFERPPWPAAPRPYLPRLFLFAAAPALLAGLAAGLLPLGGRLRAATAAAILLCGSATVPLATPDSVDSVESFSIEVARGRGWDRFEALAVTSPVGGDRRIVVAAGPEPTPVFFSPRDAGERSVEVAALADGFEIRPGRVAARSTVCVARRSTRAGTGRLWMEGSRAINETDSDLTHVAILENGAVTWIGDLPAGASATGEPAGRLSDLRGLLGQESPRRRLFDLWWRRADHDRAYLVGFAPEEPPADGAAAFRLSHGTLVVLPIR